MRNDYVNSFEMPRERDDRVVEAEGLDSSRSRAAQTEGLDSRRSRAAHAERFDSHRGSVQIEFEGSIGVTSEKSNRGEERRETKEECRVK
ncbi:hypothetical protein TNCT_215321 [Trichonephila clavata]|uniref:Uncharacterized protein n=1 Tax=Trichonephila clavata TaxID=2740835 RepID=A0A8X6HDN4_TRICU|nr:hypothetical protein TNCT_215321 [Trichonephila clavata]